MRKRLILIAVLALVAVFLLVTPALARGRNPNPGLFAPDNLFYFLDDLRDWVTTTLTFNPKAKAERLLSQASEKVAEIEVLVEKGKPQYIEKTTTRLNSRLDATLMSLERAEDKGINVEDVGESFYEAILNHQEILQSVYVKLTIKAEENELKLPSQAQGIALSQAQEAILQAIERSMRVNDSLLVLIETLKERVAALEAKVAQLKERLVELEKMKRPEEGEEGEEGEEEEGDEDSDGGEKDKDKDKDEEEGPVCTDTDGGDKAYVKGSVTAKFGSLDYISTRTDYCLDATNPDYWVIVDSCEGPDCYQGEHACEQWGDNNPVGVRYSYRCPGSCKDGVCVGKTIDLIVEDILWTPANPKVNEPVIFQVVIKNIGTAPFPADWLHCDVRYAHGVVDRPKDEEGLNVYHYVGSAVIPYVAPGASATIGSTDPATLEKGYLPPLRFPDSGHSTVLAAINPFLPGQVSPYEYPDFNTDNNLRIEKIYIAP